MMRKKILALLTAIFVVASPFVQVQAETADSAELPKEYTFNDYTDTTGATLPAGGVSASNLDVSAGAYLRSRILGGRKSMEVVNAESKKFISIRFSAPLEDEIKTIETAFCREYMDGSDATLEFYYGGKLPQLINFTKNGKITSMGVDTGYTYKENVWYDIKVTVNFTTKKMEIVIDGGDYKNLRIDTKLNYSGIATDTAKADHIIIGNRNLVDGLKSNVLVDYLRITTSTLDNSEINIRENFENFKENENFTSKIGNMTYIGYANTNSMNIATVREDMGKSLSMNRTQKGVMTQIRQAFSGTPGKITGSFSINFASGDARRGVIFQVYKDDNTTMILWPFVFAVNGKIYTNEKTDSYEMWNTDTWYDCSFEIDFTQHTMVCTLTEKDNPDGVNITAEHSLSTNIVRPYTSAVFMGGDASETVAECTTYLDNIVYSGDQNLRFCFVQGRTDNVDLKENITLVFNKDLDEAAAGSAILTKNGEYVYDAFFEIIDGNLLRVTPGTDGFEPESTYVIDISGVTDKDGKCPNTQSISFSTMAEIVTDKTNMEYEVTDTDVNAVIERNIFFADKENHRVIVVLGLYEADTNKLIKSYAKEYEGYDINISIPVSTQLDKVAGQKLVAHFWDSFDEPMPYFDITEWKGADYIE